MLGPEIGEGAKSKRDERQPLRRSRVKKRDKRFAEAELKKRQTLRRSRVKDDENREYPYHHVQHLQLNTIRVNHQSL
jgi:hypothetical protein